MQLLKSIPKALLASWIWRHQASAETKDCIVFAFQVLGVTRISKLGHVKQVTQGRARVIKFVLPWNCLCENLHRVTGVQKREKRRRSTWAVFRYQSVARWAAPCLSLVRIQCCEFARTLRERVWRKRGEGARVDQASWKGGKKQGVSASSRDYKPPQDTSFANFAIFSSSLSSAFEQAECSHSHRFRYFWT